MSSSARHLGTTESGTADDGFDFRSLRTARTDKASTESQLLQTASPRLRVLDVDPILTCGIAQSQRNSAVKLCTGRFYECRKGISREWPRDLDGLPKHALVADGYALLRSQFDGGGSSVEVVGPGDLIPIGAPDFGDEDLTIQVRALTDASFATLDDRFWTAAATWPEIGSNVATLALRRAAELSRSSALAAIPKLHHRLHFLLWRLSTRWGRVTMDGVRIPFGVLQQDLADLSGARRPSVNAAIRELRDAGQVREEGRGRYIVREPAIDESVAATRARMRRPHSASLSPTALRCSCRADTMPSRAGHPQDGKSRRRALGDTTPE